VRAAAMDMLRGLQAFHEFLHSLDEQPGQILDRFEPGRRPTVGRDQGKEEGRFFEIVGRVVGFLDQAAERLGPVHAMRELAGLVQELVGAAFQFRAAFVESLLLAAIFPRSF